MRQGRLAKWMKIAAMLAASLAGATGAQGETRFASFTFENDFFAGYDRHYTNGITLAYTTGPLSENCIWNAPTRWLGESTFLFHLPTRETDDRLEWIIVGTFDNIQCAAFA